MSWLRRVGCSAVAWAVAMCGCGGQQSQKSNPTEGAYRQVSAPVELIAQARPPIPDIPVPVGFKLDEGRSRNFAAGVYRYVDHLYKGGADKFAVARFYKRHMPISRWVLMTDMFAQGNIMLQFEKETQRCQVVASDGDMWNRCYIKVQSWTTGPMGGSAEAGGVSSR